MKSVKELLFWVLLLVNNFNTVENVGAIYKVLYKYLKGNIVHWSLKIMTLEEPLEHQVHGSSFFSSSSCSLGDEEAISSLRQGCCVALWSRAPPVYAGP